MPMREVCGRLRPSPLSCPKSAGRFPRHEALNIVVKHALDRAGLHSILEPVDLACGDGKRPDGMTTFPFHRGHSLLWDATCIDTFSPSALTLSATDPGHAARLAEERKRAKYGSLASRFLFTRVAVETSCVIGPATTVFL